VLDLKEIDDEVTAIGIADKKISAALDEALRPIGLNSSNYYFLLKIGESNELSRDELFQKISLSQSNVTRRLDQLVKLGLVVKNRSDVDKRAFVAHLTDKGKDLISGIQKAIEEVTSKAFGNLSDDKRLEMLADLRKVSRNLADY
jgi:MarR family transcriptional regulator for hemolysin